MRRPHQLEFVVRSWGGRRRGAGRKAATGRGRVHHRRRLPHEPRCPVHVTLRAAAGLQSLRAGGVFVRIRAALAAASAARFRVLQFSVQADHLHLLVEADEPTGFRRGVQGLAIRVAKAVNRALARRGRVWGDRYHARMLRTPREVRHALVYVLANWRKHVRGARGLDPRSSARWFDGCGEAGRSSPAPCRWQRLGRGSLVSDGDATGSSGSMRRRAACRRHRREVATTDAVDVGSPCPLATR